MQWSDRTVVRAYVSRTNKGRGWPYHEAAGSSTGAAIGNSVLQDRVACYRGRSTALFPGMPARTSPYLPGIRLRGNGSTLSSLHHVLAWREPITMCPKNQY